MDALDDRSRGLLFAASAATMFASTLALKALHAKFNGQLPASVPGDVKSSRKSR